jgi:hypothetical protein
MSAPVYDGPRFKRLYRRWLTEQDTVFSPVSPAIREAVTRGRAKVEFAVLAHDYEHLSPLVNRPSSRHRRLRKSEEKEGTRLRAALTRSSTRLLNPVVHPRSSRGASVLYGSPPCQRLVRARHCASVRRDRRGGVLCRLCQGSDQRRNGTQDVNDPASSPAMRPEGRSGSFTSWVPVRLKGIAAMWLRVRTHRRTRCAMRGLCTWFRTIKMTAYATVLSPDNIVV